MKFHLFNFQSFNCYCEWGIDRFINARRIPCLFSLDPATSIHKGKQFPSQFAPSFNFYYYVLYVYSEWPISQWPFQSFFTIIYSEYWSTLCNCFSLQIPTQIHIRHIYILYIPHYCNKMVILGMIDIIDLHLH